MVLFSGKVDAVVLAVVKVQAKIKSAEEEVAVVLLEPETVDVVLSSSHVSLRHLNGPSQPRDACPALKNIPLASVHVYPGLSWLMTSRYLACDCCLAEL